MAATDSERLFKELYKISEDYFGPATQRFLTRQIENHLHKSPGNLKKADIPKLVDWLRLSVGVISDDEEEINRYIDKVKKL